MAAGSRPALPRLAGCRFRGQGRPRLGRQLESTGDLARRPYQPGRCGIARRPRRARPSHDRETRRGRGARWSGAAQRQQHGGSWGFANLKLPQEVRETWDFHAVHGVGNHFWLAGRPGSVMLHSPDLGDTWEVVRTGQPLPLNGVFFLDEKRGWAVGELGAILGTTDGGKTWQVQRRGGQRSAVLFIHARAAGMPLDTVSVLGARDGYLSTALRVTGPDFTSAAPDRATDGQRLSYAWRQAGGASAELLWQFPVASHLAQGSVPT